jgi:hypothetical protein
MENEQEIRREMTQQLHLLSHNELKALRNFELKLGEINSTYLGYFDKSLYYQLPYQEMFKEILGYSKS